MSAMLELDELEPILGGNCMTPGPSPGRSQAGVIPIPKSLAVGASPSHIRDGPLENLWGGRAKYKKKIRAREN